MGARIRGRGLRAVLLVGALAAFGLTACKPPPPPGGTTVTFSCTGAEETWTVPAGVTQITVDAYGAQGAPLGTGTGLGGRATATIDVTPDDILGVNVGCQGGEPLDCPGDGGLGGFGGGGDGGSGECPGSGGGGASDVRDPAGAGLANRLVVAGGGGGDGFIGGDGGDGGDLTGNDGGDGVVGGGGGGTPGGGGGGTQLAGGAAGTSFGAPVSLPEPGSLGLGGDGGGDFSGGAGGGGGGYYGGGGGGIGDDGGAGGGGGGGSGFGPAGTTFETGVRVGDGLVKITYAS